MRKFLGSLWFSLLVCLVLAGVTTGAYALLEPSADAVGNYELARIFGWIGWGVGPAIGLLSFVFIIIINILRRIFRVRRVGVLHFVTNVLGVLPWLVFSWILLDEPRFTAFARAVLDFAARPMLWGSLAATLFAALFSLPVFLKKKS